MRWPYWLRPMTREERERYHDIRCELELRLISEPGITKQQLDFLMDLSRRDVSIWVKTNKGKDFPYPVRNWRNR